MEDNEIQNENREPQLQNVDLIRACGKEIFLVGTAHISKSSVELVKDVINEKKPDVVAVELCQSRFNSMKDPNRWKNMDLFSVIKQGKVYVLIVQLVLAAFQKKLGKNLNVAPGAEMMTAIEEAEKNNIQLALIDRDIKITLRRTWNKLGFISMMKVVFAMIYGAFSDEKIGEEEIERLKSTDALEGILQDFSKSLPVVRQVLIDERDQYLAAKILGAEGEKVVAIIGAGHAKGVKSWLEKNKNDIDVSSLEVIPPTKLLTRILGLLIPALAVFFIAYGFFTGGMDEGMDKIYTWCIVTAIAAGLGSILALAHPLTVIFAAISAPITTIHPLLTSGMVAGLSEALLRKPKVKDLETITDDIATFSGLFKNGVTRILLVFLLTNAVGSLGTLLALYLLK